MKIKTKHNVGDEVWFIFDGKPLSGIIKNIGTFISIVVELKGKSYCFRREAKGFDLFATKEELIKNL